VTKRAAAGQRDEEDVASCAENTERVGERGIEKKGYFREGVGTGSHRPTKN
jgi:hypothetical protein